MKSIILFFTNEAGESVWLKLIPETIRKIDFT